MTATLTIALGVGANTAVYAVVHAVLLEPLPFRQPEDLVQLWETHPDLHNLQVSVPDYLDWKRSLTTLNVAAYTFQAMDKAALLGQGEPAAVQATNASADLFPLLGIKPLLGRLYGSVAEKQKEHVVLISEQLWRQKFAGDPRVIGRSLRLDTTSFTVVGVLPNKTSFPAWADVWMPFSLIEPELYATRKFHPLEVIGRLKPGASLRQAEIKTEQIAHRLSSAYPATNGKIGALIIPLMEAVTGEARPALIAVWVAVGLVLLIACANLAHLMLSRALNRRHEIALRLALGASRFAAFRTFLLEASILAAVGGLLGIVTGAVALPLIRKLGQEELPRLPNVHLNAPVLLFGAAASLVVALVFALPSYLQVLRSDLNSTISSASTRGSAKEPWLSPVLMASEVALSVAVLLAAVLLVRSFSFTMQTPPGFEPRGVLVMHSTLFDQDWPRSYALFHSRIAPALQNIPGVQEVAAVNSVPMSLGTTEHSRFATRFGIADRTFEPGRFPTAQIRWCTANYFHVLGIPLLRGRLLTEADHGRSVYLINRTFARNFFPHSDPVGKKLLLGVVTPNPESDEIVGVVGDTRDFGLSSAAEPTMYSVDISPGMDVVIKTATMDTAVRNAISRTMRLVDPQQPVGSVRPLSAYVSDSLARQRFVLALIATFAALAICLCGIGVYGVFSYSITRRMREFGIRSAIGAGREDLLRQVFFECLRVIGPGLAAGLAISWASPQLLRSLLYRTSPTDALASLSAAAGILVLCLSAVAIPAVRAARVDAAITLREQ